MAKRVRALVTLGFTSRKSPGAGRMPCINHPGRCRAGCGLASDAGWGCCRLLARRWASRGEAAGACRALISPFLPSPLPALRRTAARLWQPSQKAAQRSAAQHSPQLLAFRRSSGQTPAARRRAPSFPRVPHLGSTSPPGFGGSGSRAHPSPPRGGRLGEAPRPGSSSRPPLSVLERRSAAATCPAAEPLAAPSPPRLPGLHRASLLPSQPRRGSSCLRAGRREGRRPPPLLPPPPPHPPVPRRAGGMMEPRASRSLRPLLSLLLLLGALCLPPGETPPRAAASSGGSPAPLPAPRPPSPPQNPPRGGSLPEARPRGGPRPSPAGVARGAVWRPGRPSAAFILFFDF